jgi:hypothetical protein
MVDFWVSKISGGGLDSLTGAERSLTENFAAQPRKKVSHDWQYCHSSRNYSDGGYTTCQVPLKVG